MKLSEEKEKWLEVRRKTITDYFNVPASEQSKVDKVFEDMAQIAERCSDQGEFEREMLTSPVNTAYNNLFTGLAKYVKNAQGPSSSEFKKDLAVGTAKSVVKTQVRNGIIGWLVNLLPNWITDWWIYREYNIPGVGEAKSAMNQYDQTAGRVKRGYEDAQERERLEKELEEADRKRKEEEEENARRIKEMQDAAMAEMEKYKNKD
ncbi:MAG: hypothetical protein KBT32_04280 [Bacteroidales bacterium]|nr:hypothetical protein [Candidatus Physcocola equi]